VGLTLALAGAVVFIVLDRRRAAQQRQAFTSELKAIATSVGGVTRLRSVPTGEAARALGGPMCVNCSHFDLEEGQALLAEQKVFMLAASEMTPAMMSRERKFDDRGHPLPPEQQPAASIPSKARWDEFGACNIHEEGRWKHDKCDQYKAREVA
jgi:hypothetical protein